LVPYTTLFRSYIERPGHGQYTLWIGVQYKAVRIIVADQDIMPFAESNDFIKHFCRSLGTRGHVWVIDPHHLDLGQVFFLDFGQIGQPVVCLAKFVRYYRGATNPYGTTICRIAGIGYQYLVACFQVSHTDVHNTLFGTNEWQHLIVGIQGNAVITLIPVRHSLAQYGRTFVALVTVCMRKSRLFRKRFDHFRVWR